VRDKPRGRNCSGRPAGVGFRARSQNRLIIRTGRAMSRGIWGHSRSFVAFHAAGGAPLLALFEKGAPAQLPTANTAVPLIGPETLFITFF